MARINAYVATAVATGLHELGNAGTETVSSFLVAVRNASSFSAVVRGTPIGQTVTTSDPPHGYDTLQAPGLGTDGATPITANGNYRVMADGCALALHVSAGTATVTIVPLAG